LESSPVDPGRKKGTRRKATFRKNSARLDLNQRPCAPEPRPAAERPDATVATAITGNELRETGSAAAVGCSGWLGLFCFKLPNGVEGRSELRFRAGTQIAIGAVVENAPKRCPASPWWLSKDIVLNSSRTVDNRREVGGQNNRFRGSASAPPFVRPNAEANLPGPRATTLTLGTPIAAAVHFSR
jgi:hypothetical protein